MSVLANMMTKLMPYVCENNLEFKELLILTDVALCCVRVDLEEEESLSSYVDTMSKMNDLYSVFEIEDLDQWKEHVDGVVFDNTRVAQLSAYPAAVVKFQERRLNIWNEIYPQLITAVRSFPQPEEELDIEDLPL